VNRSGTEVYFAAARPNVRHVLNRAGLKPPLVRLSASVADVKAAAQ